jgi:type I restriction enzyme S subunit
MREIGVNRTLGEIASIEMGQSLNGNSYNTLGKGVPLINGPTEFTNRYPVPRQWTTEPTKVCKNGDLLLCVRGSVGRINIADNEFCIGRGVASIRANVKDIHQLFLIELVKYEVEKITRLSSGSTFPNVNKATLTSCKVRVPSLPEQRKIAAILRTWDDAIEKMGKLIITKEHRIDHLVVLLFQLSNAHGERHTFGDFLSESNIVGSTGASARKITIKLYGKGLVAKKEKNAGSISTRYYVRRSGQLIYSKLDFLNGAFGIVPDALDGYESTQDLPAFDIAPSINPRWLLEYLLRDKFYTSCVGIARGLRKARRVNPSDFLEMPLKVPPRKIQDRIAETISYARYDLERTKYQQSLIQSQKRGLMQKLLTGQWRVNFD